MSDILNDDNGINWGKHPPMPNPQIDTFEDAVEDLRKKLDDLELNKDILWLVVTEKISVTQCKEIYKMIHAKDEETITFAKALVERLISEING